MKTGAFVWISEIGNIKEDLLGITSVHPMCEDSVREYLKRTDADWGVIILLIERGSLREVEYQGNNFYLRKFTDRAEQCSFSHS